MAGLMLSAAWKSSGKTTLGAGIVAGLARRGMRVQPFKKGPDYIDPMWLSLAAARACRNLDPRLQGDGLGQYFARHAAGADLSFVEGNLGLHDGFELDGRDSNAAVAKALGLPVVLVLDARGMTRGLAAVLRGLQVFDPAVRIAGVILNRLSGSRHEARIRAAVEHYTDVPVLGALHEQVALALVERHLGLMPSNEAAEPQRTVLRIADTVEAGVDLDALLAASHGATAPVADREAPGGRRPGSGPVIGIARDRAFGFYYADDLEAFAAEGAQLVTIDTLKDETLPKLDGLVIGGGFPEMLSRALEANVALRSAIRRAIEGGLPVYAECGGLMYLARSLTFGGDTRQMVGALPLDITMHAKPVGKGYVTLEETEQHPWPSGTRGQILAHEFHYSSAENVDPDLRYAYRVRRGHGVGGGRDGIVYRNVLASYAHLRDVAGPGWVSRFLEFVRQCAAAPALHGSLR